MAVNISYKCPNCGAELFWSADKNCWACEYCDGQFTLKDLEEAGGDAKRRRNSTRITLKSMKRSIRTSTVCQMTEL